MTFDYINFEVDPSPTNPIGMFRRPELVLRLRGDRSDEYAMALVDTGADECVLPLSLADSLGVAVDPSKSIRAAGAGGQLIELLPGLVELEIADGSESYCWHAVVGFARFESPEHESTCLGHVGALEFFTATFDGGAHRLTLVPNVTFPGQTSSS